MIFDLLCNSLSSSILLILLSSFSKLRGVALHCADISQRETPRVDLWSAWCMRVFGGHGDHRDIRTFHTHFGDKTMGFFYIFLGLVNICRIARIEIPFLLVMGICLFSLGSLSTSGTNCCLVSLQCHDGLFHAGKIFVAHVDEFLHPDFLGLPGPVASPDGLQLRCWVPGWCCDVHPGGFLQIETHPARLNLDEENWTIWGSLPECPEYSYRAQRLEQQTHQFGTPGDRPRRAIPPTYSFL